MRHDFFPRTRHVHQTGHPLSFFSLLLRDSWIDPFTLSFYSLAGAFVGVLAFDMLTRRMGYKFNMWVWYVACIVLCVGFGFEKSFWLFVLMRFLLGIFGHVSGQRHPRATSGFFLIFLFSTTLRNGGNNKKVHTVPIMTLFVWANF